MQSLNAERKRLIRRSLFFVFDWDKFLAPIIPVDLPSLVK